MPEDIAAVASDISDLRLTAEPGIIGGVPASGAGFRGGREH